MGVFEKADIVSRDSFDQMFGRRQLAQSNPEMVCIVECIEKVLVKGMYILQTGEPIENECNFFCEGLLCVSDFSCIKSSYSTDFESRSDLSGEASLGAAQHDIQEFLARWHRLYVFPSGLHGGDT